jgi:hypothetical protein
MRDLPLKQSPNTSNEPYSFYFRAKIRKHGWFLKHVFSNPAPVTGVNYLRFIRQYEDYRLLGFAVV